MDNHRNIDFGEFFRTRVAQGQVTFEEDIDGYTEKSIAFSILISRSENDSPVKYKLHKLIGKGASGKVYSLITFDGKKQCNDLVAKVFSQREEYFENEQKIMDKIAQRQNPIGEVGKLREHSDGTIMYELDNLSDKFIKRVAANRNKYVIIYNRGEKLQYPITREQFDQMFDCMRELRNIGIIHRDITPGHFLSAKASDGSEKVFLVGFSSAVFNEKGDKWNASNIESSSNQVIYDGLILCASTEILDCLLKFLKGSIPYCYVPQRRHDLESFVKMFYLLNIFQDKDWLEIYKPIGTQIKYAHEYWHNFENKAHSFWKEALAIAREDMVEKLYDHLKEFQSFSLRSIRFRC